VCRWEHNRWAQLIRSKKVALEEDEREIIKKEQPRAEGRIPNLGSETLEGRILKGFWQLGRELYGQKKRQKRVMKWVGKKRGGKKAGKRGHHIHVQWE